MRNKTEETRDQEYWPQDLSMREREELLCDWFVWVFSDDDGRGKPPIPEGLDYDFYFWYYGEFLNEFYGGKEGGEKEVREFAKKHRLCSVRKYGDDESGHRYYVQYRKDTDDIKDYKDVIRMYLRKRKEDNIDKITLDDGRAHTLRSILMDVDYEGSSFTGVEVSNDHIVIMWKSGKHTRLEITEFLYNYLNQECSVMGLHIMIDRSRTLSFDGEEPAFA